MRMKPANLFIAILIAFILLAVAVNIARAARLHHEAEYVTTWCEPQKGIEEFRLIDPYSGDFMGRVDCLTATHAVEFDFADKWAEGVGQALFYSSRTGKRAGLALIIEDPKDNRHVVKVKALIAAEGLPLDLWVVTW